MSQLNLNDYKEILEYYKITIPKSSRLIKLQAEQILAEKLCRCIKKVDLQNESRAIGICTKNILNRKGIKRCAFSCKKKPTIVITKMKKNNTKKLI